MRSRAIKPLLGAWIALASVWAMAADKSPRTIEVLITRDTGGVRGVILPEQRVQIAIDCKLFGVSKLVIAEERKIHDLNEYPIGTNRSPRPRPAHSRYALSSEASTVLCSTANKKVYKLTIEGETALMEGADGNFFAVDRNGQKI